MPTDPVELITTILTFIMLISNFILMIIMWVDKARTPEKSQNVRIERLEDQVDQLFVLHDKDKDRIKELEKGNIVTQEAILALLSNALDGNNKEGLIRAKGNLEKYLTHKGVALEDN